VDLDPAPRQRDQIDQVAAELAVSAPPVPFILAASPALPSAALGDFEHRREQVDDVLGEAGAVALADELVVEEVEAGLATGAEDDQVLLAPGVAAVPLPDASLVGLGGQHEAAEARAQKGQRERPAATGGLARSGGPQDQGALDRLAQREVVSPVPIQERSREVPTAADARRSATATKTFEHASAPWRACIAAHPFLIRHRPAFLLRRASWLARLWGRPSRGFLAVKKYPRVSRQ
jgi:hypothetical protein